MVDHPQHYGGEDNSHEHVKCMEAIVGDSAFDGFVGSMIYNCTKYLWRLGKKESFLQDAKKAQWYLNRLVEYLEKPTRKAS